jgi:hypothetical protein
MALQYGVPSPASAVIEAFSADTSMSGIMATVAMVSLPRLPLVVMVSLSIAPGRALSPYNDLLSLCTALQGQHCLVVTCFTFVANEEKNNTD